MKKNTIPMSTPMYCDCPECKQKMVPVLLYYYSKEMGMEYEYITVEGLEHSNELAEKAKQENDIGGKPKPKPKPKKSLYGRGFAQNTSNSGKGSRDWRYYKARSIARAENPEQFRGSDEPSD